LKTFKLGLFILNIISFPVLPYPKPIRKPIAKPKAQLHLQACLRT